MHSATSSVIFGETIVSITVQIVGSVDRSYSFLESNMYCVDNERCRQRKIRFALISRTRFCPVEAWRQTDAVSSGRVLSRIHPMLRAVVIWLLEGFIGFLLKRVSIAFCFNGNIWSEMPKHRDFGPRN